MPLFGGVPAAGDVELVVEQQEPAGQVTLRVAEHRDHDLAGRQAVDRVRTGEIRLRDDFFRADHLVHLWPPRVGDVDDVDASRLQAGHDQEPPHVFCVAVAAAARVPAEVMQLVPELGHGHALNHLRIGGRSRVDVDDRQKVGLLDRRCGVRRGDESDLFALALHGLPRRRVGGVAGTRFRVTVGGQTAVPQSRRGRRRGSSR